MVAQGNLRENNISSIASSYRYYSPSQPCSYKDTTKTAFILSRSFSQLVCLFDLFSIQFWNLCLLPDAMCSLRLSFGERCQHSVLHCCLGRSFNLHHFVTTDSALGLYSWITSSASGHRCFAIVLEPESIPDGSQRTKSLCISDFH